MKKLFCLIIGLISIVSCNTLVSAPPTARGDQAAAVKSDQAKNACANKSQGDVCEFTWGRKYLRSSYVIHRYVGTCDANYCSQITQAID